MFPLLTIFHLLNPVHHPIAFERIGACGKKQDAIIVCFYREQRKRTTTKWRWREKWLAVVNLNVNKHTIGEHIQWTTLLMNLHRFSYTLTNLPNISHTIKTSWFTIATKPTDPPAQDWLRSSTLATLIIRATGGQVSDTLKRVMTTVSH